MTSQAMVLTRAWPVVTAALDFDRWQAAKHVPDLVGSGLIDEARYYVALEEGLRPRFVGVGLRMAVYFAPDVGMLRQYLDSATVAEAVADGITWFDSFHRLDGEPFTGNMYVRVADRGDPARSGPLGAARAADAPDAGPGDGYVLVVRWEHPDRTADSRARVAAELLDLIAALPGVATASSWCVTDLPIAIPFYRSPGADMIWTEIASRGALDEVMEGLRDGGAGKMLDQVAGEARYATHEIFRFSFRVASAAAGDRPGSAD
jgi:hypothetical protein